MVEIVFPKGASCIGAPLRRVRRGRRDGSRPVAMRGRTGGESVDALSPGELFLPGGQRRRGDVV